MTQPTRNVLSVCKTVRSVNRAQIVLSAAFLTRSSKENVYQSETAQVERLSQDPNKSLDVQQDAPIAQLMRDTTSNASR